MIDVTFDFTRDTPHYWDHFWENNGGLGGGGSDPDSASKKLREYHRILWSKQLPNGERMELRCGRGSEYLTWKGFRFGSDSIFASFRHQRCRSLIESVERALPDYRAFIEEYVHKSYTIGGETLFPKHAGSVNQARGTHPLIRDRWDLTLECIRRFYAGQASPLSAALQRDKAFFDLFVDFRGYVDFFFLQDCVSRDYARVDIWLGNGDFNEDPLPRTVGEYLAWIEAEMRFLDRRNRRIEESLSKEQHPCLNLSPASSAN